LSTLFQELVGYPTTSSVETTERAEAMKMLFARFTLDETGATAIEWGLVAVGILVAIISVVWLR